MLFSGDPQCAYIFHPLVLHLARANKPNSTLILCFWQWKKDWLPEQSSNCQLSTNCFVFFIWNKSDQVYGDKQAMTYGKNAQWWRCLLKLINNSSLLSNIYLHRDNASYEEMRQIWIEFEINKATLVAKVVTVITSFNVNWLNRG